MPVEFQSIPFATYLAAPGLSSSFLRGMSRSPAHAKCAAESERDSAQMLIGRALHCAVLEPSRYGESFRVGPCVDARTKAGKAEWAAFEASCKPDTELLSPKEDDAVRGMSASLRGHGLARQLLFRDGVKTEQSIFWEHRGLTCKARIDCITEFFGAPMVVDLKTTQNAGDFERSITKYGYHVQEAWYRRGLKAAGFTPERFMFIAVESTAPYGVAIYELDQAYLDAANAEIETNLATYAECVKSGNWPGYKEEIRLVTCPVWLGEGAEEASFAE